MATFTGSFYADTITPDVVSSRVVREPGSKPSAAADRIDGLGANDILHGGGGADIINGGDGHDTIGSTAGGGTVHGDGGNDEITITPDVAWKTVAAEPDGVSDGTNLRFQFTGAQLSVTGEPDTAVIAADGIIEDPGPGAPDGPHNFATTGTLVFGQDPANSPGGGWGQGMPLWNAEEFGLLRVDFDEPTNFVSIDFAFDDDDVGSLKAFDAAGNLLDAVTGSGDGRGPNPTFTGSIARETADISYVTAGGVAREALYLDNLHYNVQAESDAISGTFYGDDGNDQIAFRSSAWLGGQPSGTLTLSGGAGDDRIASEGVDVSDYSRLTIRAYGDAGNDRLEAFASYTFSNVYEWAPDGNDYLYGGAGDDTYWVMGPDDAVIENAGEGYDTVEVYDTSYTLTANVERLVVDEATGGAYSYTGNALSNEIVGDYGNDTIFGKSLGLPQGSGPDADTIHGGDGNDLIYGAGSGSDTWDGDDLIYGDAGNDTLHGVIGNDAMFGGDGTDVMFGGEGNDTMDGGAGNDDVRGQNGTDTLIGGAGLDRLMGGAGNDTFDYNAVTDSRAGATLRDVITTAFDGVGAAAGDKIDLATIDANSGLGGNQAFTFRGTGAITAASQVRVAALGTDTLVQANVGGTLAADMEILVKDGTALPGQWAAGDFVL